LPLVTDKHKQLTDCIAGVGNQKWDADYNLKEIAETMSLHHSFAAWTRIPKYDFQSVHSFGVPALHGPLLLIVHVTRNCHGHC
jgi:hypothetical protein